MYINVLFLLLLIDFGRCESGPRVTIAQGQIEGTYKTSYYGRRFAAYEGIPFAKPPVDQLRFKEPQPAEGWPDVLHANKSYVCAHFFPIPFVGGYQGKEDCLYVYVYVPIDEITITKKLPVVVHIHGGAYMMGSPQLMSGPDYLMDKNVVYVTLNYRLGILGFASTEDTVISGNNGLKDQTLAMKWIKENIDAFGGDSNSITLTGLSAGGSSVHYHYLSPLSRGLFHRGYSQSGTALQPWALTEHPLTNLKRVSLALNCSTGHNAAMADCLRKVPPKELVMGTKVLSVFFDGVPFTPFGPTIEQPGANAFLPDHPYKLLKERKIYDVPWIASNVRNEGIIPAGFIALFHKFEDLNEKWNEAMVYLLDINNTVVPSEWNNVVSKVKQFYLKNEDEVSLENINELVQMFTDRVYLVDAEKAIRAHVKASKSPVYYSFYSYVASQPTAFRDIPNGVCHADDGKLMWKMIIAPKELPSADEMMKDYLVEFIVNYAYSGKPSFQNIDWTPMKADSEEISYLDIGSLHNISMRTRKEFAPTAFYNSLPIMENDKLFP